MTFQLKNWIRRCLTLAHACSTFHIPDPLWDKASHSPFLLPSLCFSWHFLPLYGQYFGPRFTCYGLTVDCTLCCYDVSLCSHLRRVSFILFYFWPRWVFVAVCGLSLVAMRGGYSSLWCAVFSLWWLLLLQSMGSSCVGLVAPRHMGSSQTGDRTRVPCIGRRILNHCTTREVPRHVS